MTATDRPPSPPVDLAVRNGYDDPPPRMGFFTDTSVCIGCKACEVACKEWNNVPEDGLDLLGMSMDNTGMLGANSWRHVAFVEQRRPGTVGLEEQTVAVEARLRGAPRGGSELGTEPLPTPPEHAVQDLG
ncbi:MAG: hypothetical protein ACJ72K_08015, partial [Friedmanniella sp.]